MRTEEDDRLRVELPLRVSHEAFLDAERPFGRAWRALGERAPIPLPAAS